MVVNQIPFRKVRTPRNIQSQFYQNTHRQKSDRQGSFNERGFSLLELLIVVGIIGALAAVALPQFQVFLMRSKQSQAKIMVSNVSTALNTFYAEWGIYFGDFRDIGYAPEGYFYYTVNLDTRGQSLPSHYPKPAASGFGGTLGAGNIMTEGNFGYSVLNYYCNGENTYGVPTGHPSCESDGQLGVLSDVTQNGYGLYIAGDLDEDAHVDLWSFCHNHYDPGTCPASGHGLQLVFDDLTDKSPSF